MKIFHCDHCRQALFFENSECLRCGNRLAYLPDLEVLASLEPDGERWVSPLPRAQGRSYRLCRNYTDEEVCNWALPADEPGDLCLSCRLTRVLPDLGVPGHREAWYRMEVAKRRLVYTLRRLELPLVDKAEDGEGGLAFEFLADDPDGAEGPVLTGHSGGVITINIAEADDAERERRRLQLHEPYRTLLGHFRHEIGHYYWDRLIRDGARHSAFRQLFGDESRDYSEALQRHYHEGPNADWPTRFVSAYASSHPWEDWAETWAHYLHIVDSLETASVCGIVLQPPREGEPVLQSPAVEPWGRPFDAMLADWFALSYVLNNLNRGLGLGDAYPFVLSTPVIDKLRFVHDTIVAVAPHRRA